MGRCLRGDGRRARPHPQHHQPPSVLAHRGCNRRGVVGRPGALETCPAPGLRRHHDRDRPERLLLDASNPGGECRPPWAVGCDALPVRPDHDRTRPRACDPWPRLDIWRNPYGPAGDAHRAPAKPRDNPNRLACTRDPRRGGERRLAHPRWVGNPNDHDHVRGRCRRVPRHERNMGAPRVADAAGHPGDPVRVAPLRADVVDGRPRWRRIHRGVATGQPDACGGNRRRHGACRHAGDRVGPHAPGNPDGITPAPAGRTHGLRTRDRPLRRRHHLHR